MKTSSRPYLPFFVFAVVLPALFLTVHLAGFRVYTSVWAGTHSGEPWTLAAGAAYLILYVLCVGLAPIFALAGGLLWLDGWVFPARKG